MWGSRGALLCAGGRQLARWVIPPLLIPPLLLPPPPPQTVHGITHFFERRGRPGVVKAIQAVVSELTLLGLFGLILQAFSSPLSKICGRAAAGWGRPAAACACPQAACLPR